MLRLLRERNDRDGQEEESEESDSSVARSGNSGLNRTKEEVPRSGYSGRDSEQGYHLLEDDERINDILRSLPTEEYYAILRNYVVEKFPGIRPDVAEHLCELEEFFDVCIAIGFSLGVGKMELKI